MVDASTTASLIRVVCDDVDQRDTGVLAISHDDELLRTYCRLTGRRRVS